MERHEVHERLRSLIADHLEAQVPLTLKESDRLYEDLSLDSIMVLQLMVYIEEEFGVSVPEEDVDPSVFATIGSVVSFIQALRETKV